MIRPLVDGHVRGRGTDPRAGAVASGAARKDTSLAPRSNEPGSHDHLFLASSHERNARRTWIVVALTSATMTVEIVAGLAYGSMALLADGVHMATHAGALAVSGIAYLLARRWARSPAFTFGTGKLGDLGAWSSALLLLLAAGWVAIESALRLVAAPSIRLDEALLVAVVGLLVNLASAALLYAGHTHDHGHVHKDQAELHPVRANAHHHHVHRDHNVRAAFAHVVTDALTSVLAIAALLAGRQFGWLWLDPLVGILGAVLIALWALALLRDSAAVLLDRLADPTLAERIRALLETDGARVTDLHLWRVGPGHLALVVSLVSDTPHPPQRYKERLRALEGLSHVTIEFNARASRRRAA